MTSRKSFVYRARVMTPFKTLTYEGLQVGEEFVSDTFLVTPEEIEPAVGTASGVVR